MLFGLQRPELDPRQIADAKNRLQTRMEQDPTLPSMQPGRVPAEMFSPGNQAGSEPAAAFQWGEGGERLTPEAIAARRAVAQQQTAAGMDFSPVAHWTQGAARVAQALLGTMEQKKLDRADRQNMTAEQSILQSLAGTGAGSGGGAGAGTANDPAMLAAMSSPYMSDRARDALKLQWQANHKTPAQPHYWETNNGSLGVIGPDGKPQVLYKDPDSKMNFVPDGMGGGSWVAIPSQSDGAPPAAVPVRPVGKLTPITGGAPSQGGVTFP